MKKKLLFAVLVLILVLSAAFVACDNTVIYKITFDAQNGSEATVIDFDENFAMPANPTNGEKVFGGWFTDSACTTGNEFAVPKELKSDITVYAKWDEPKKFYVTFDAQNGTEPQKVLFDDNFKLPDSPKKDGVVFQGWFTDADCSEGNEWSVPKTLSADVTVYAKWHQHDYGDNYMMFTPCRNGCGTVSRNKTTNSAKESFIYDFDETKQAEIDEIFAAILKSIEKGTDTEGFEELWNEYDDSVSYVIEQYQFAYVFYHTYDTQEYEDKFDFVSDYYNECVKNYYSLYRKIYESALRDFFFEGWTEEDIQQALIMSDSYGSEEYTDVKNKIDSLTLEYDALIRDNAALDQISDLYGDLVKLNNQLAQLAGYNNYMEYAYESKFERYYTPEDVAPMRQYVKQYLAPSFSSLISSYISGVNGLKGANKKFYDSVGSVTVFGTSESAQTVINYLGEYFKQMVKADSAKPIDFFDKANAIFRDGNYYTGKQSGAFSYYISSRDTTILYFSSSYQNSFTFAHEFGHYYNNIYNGGLSLSMDHDETQSQGDEMMFLAWLYANKPEDVTSGYNALVVEQLLNTVATIVLATAVDEFEYAVYTGMYNGQPLETTDGKVDYSALFVEVLSSYSKSFVSYPFDQSEYWSYVVFDQAGYYISYAMSALPSLEIYVNAREDFDAAKESYLKLFTFSDNPEFVETDEDGYRTVTANYGEILTYCGLKTPFQEEMYLHIAKFLQEFLQ